MDPGRPDHTATFHLPKGGLGCTTWTLWHHSVCGSSDTCPLPSDLRYVTNLYHDVLGRTASAGEINGWAQSIANGASRAQVANGFLASAEYRTNLVAADYQQTLHRAADPSGSAYFVGQLNNGVKNEDVLIALAASDEYFISRGGSTNSGFVSALYQDLLQRTAAPSEVASWTQQMSHGMSRATVVRGFVTAQEYRTKLVSAYYQHYLGRAADPGGLSNFVAVLNNGGTDESVITGLVASDEYYKK